MRRGRRSSRRAAVAAVGALCAALVWGPAGAVPGASHAVLLPTPTAWGTPPFVRYTPIACRVVGACTTAGSYTTTASRNAPVVDTQRGGAWVAPRAIAFPSGTNPATTSGTMRSIACASQSSCIAVGGYTDTSAGPGTQPMLAVESANVWGAATSTIPVPAGTTQASLSAISCPAAGACVLAGSAATGAGTTFHAFVDRQVAGVWQPSVTLPDPVSSKVPHPKGVLPWGIACASAPACVVVGGLVGANREVGFAEVEHGGGWTTRVFAASGTFSLLDAVDCPSVTTCMAVGALAPTSTGGIAPFAVRLASGGWSGEMVLGWRFPAPVLRGGFLFGVACPATTLCVATGQLLGTSPGDFPVAYTWSHGAWSAPALVATPRIDGTPSSGTLLGVSCPSTAGCAAIGSATSPSLGGDHPFSTVVQPFSRGSVPSAPTSVSVAVRHGAFDVAWHEPAAFGGSPILAFVVVARSPGEPTVSCVAVSLTCTLGGIAAHHRYTVDVTAKNAARRVGPTARRTATGA